jgi:hypothetical protein
VNIAEQLRNLADEYEKAITPTDPLPSGADLLTAHRRLVPLMGQDGLTTTLTLKSGGRYDDEKGLRINFSVAFGYKTLTSGTDLQAVIREALTKIAHTNLPDVPAEAALAEALPEDTSRLTAEQLADRAGF